MVAGGIFGTTLGMEGTVEGRDRVGEGGTGTEKVVDVAKVGRVVIDRDGTRLGLCVHVAACARSGGSEGHVLVVDVAVDGGGMDGMDGERGG